MRASLARLLVFAICLAIGLTAAKAARAQCAGPAVLPVINSIVPGAAPAGALVVISVTWNGVGACLEKVTFGGVQSPLAVWDGVATVTAIVPAVAPGSAPVVVDMFIGGPSNPFPFTVTTGGGVLVVRVSDLATAAGVVDFTIERESDGMVVDHGSWGVEIGDDPETSASQAVLAIEAGGLGPGIVAIDSTGDGDLVVSSTEGMKSAVCLGTAACGAGAEIPPDQLVLGQTWGLPSLAEVPALGGAGLLLLGVGLALTSAIASRYGGARAKQARPGSP